MHELSLFEKWRLYTEGLTSPDNYINFGFYYMIGAALQRRVWIGPEHLCLYPNHYTILVGEPGIGKGILLKQVNNLLRYHKMPDPKAVLNGNLPNDISPTDRANMEAVAEADYRLAQGIVADEKTKVKSKSFERPLLFPVAADATTYEALVKAVAIAVRRRNFYAYDEKQGKETLKVYTHSSLCFCLEEIASLFRKRTEDVVNFLLQAYDCGDYVYDTKTQGKDSIKKCCLSLLGGTTPNFMQSTFDDRLLTEGFSSRTFFIFAAQNRKTQLWVPDLRQEQKEAYVDIQVHLEKLAHLFGRVSVSKEDEAWLEDWWVNEQRERSNTSSKLIAYYARKQIHVLKLAMCIHFAESLDMIIPRSAFQKAIDMLAKEEKTMHYALGIDRSNPLSVPADKIYKDLLTNGKKTRKELLIDHWASLPQGADSLDSVIEYLTICGKIIQQTEKIEEQGIEKIYYDAIRQR